MNAIQNIISRSLIKRLSSLKSMIITKQNKRNIYLQEYRYLMNTLTASGGTPWIDIERFLPDFLDCFNMPFSTGEVIPCR